MGARASSRLPPDSVLFPVENQSLTRSCPSGEAGQSLHLRIDRGGVYSLRGGNVTMKKSRGGRMTAAKKRAAKRKGGKGPVSKRKAGKNIMKT